MTQSSHRPKRVAIFNDTSPGGHYGCFAVMGDEPFSETMRAAERLVKGGGYV
ncbi:hypothetical protein [Celeribacter halophilus]|uniref:Uncharacterized protein n=1 Tax=Celeribacter halophilus TaxID=576117 RepID=A0A1I3PXK2_9RHOB|nr:hypothetical protein [Celeribacter halophilus]PZX13943.1 hypothetical protein LX82_00741 [Celeribacter halophilus]SFJ25666.1 hypothetical protein SAMN04488138_10389 [Celeribacter halophilus]